MPTLTTEEAVEILTHLPTEQQRDILVHFAASRRNAVVHAFERNEPRIQAKAREQGIAWDTLDDEQKQDFIEQWLQGKD